ncbi:MAG: hypothetical protein ACP5PQ_05720 [Thermoproteota archaeon]
MQGRRLQGKIYLRDLKRKGDLKANIVAAKLFAVLLTCCGAVLLYYTVNTGEALGITYPFFLFTSVVIMLLGLIGLIFRLRE